MAAIEVGRQCIKIAGREAGKKCEIVAIIDENFVEIDGEEVKNRRCNINHLEPMSIIQTFYILKRVRKIN